MRDLRRDGIGQVRGLDEVRERADKKENGASAAVTDVALVAVVVDAVTTTVHAIAMLVLMLELLVAVVVIGLVDAGVVAKFQ